MDVSPPAEPALPTELPLPGGNFSGVVRVRNTVRRRAGPWTPSVHALLRYLEDAGFEGAPRALGMDTQGREILSYVHGDAFQYPMPDFVWSDDTLVSVAQLLRAYHDTVRAFVPAPDAVWQDLGSGSAPGPIVCHNDIGPYNTVFRDTVPLAFIDWDTASPGPALRDVAYAAWRWVPLQDASWAQIEDQPGRLRRFCDAYGLSTSERDQILPFARQAQESAEATITVWGKEGRPGWAELTRLGLDQDMRDCLAWLQANETVLRSALTH